MTGFSNIRDKDGYLRMGPAQGFNQRDCRTRLPDGDGMYPKNLLTLKRSQLGRIIPAETFTYSATGLAVTKTTQDIVRNQYQRR